MDTQEEQGGETLAGRPACAFANMLIHRHASVAHAVSYTAGSYEVLRTIGAGSFGTALLVRTRSTGKLVVIKQIRLQELGTKDRLEAMNEVIWVLAVGSNTRTTTPSHQGPNSFFKACACDEWPNSEGKAMCMPGLVATCCL